MAGEQATRLTDVDYLKGFAILLVVYGHMLTAGSVPESAQWYVLSKNFIYRFHMPLFMFVSGITFGISVRRLLKGSDFKTFLVDRANRLLVPFVAMAIFIIGIKFAASTIITVPNYSADIIKNFTGIVFYDRSPVKFIWFLAVLFLFHIFAYIWLVLLRAPTLWLPVFGAALYGFGLFVPRFDGWWTFLFFNQIISNLLFFSVGVAFASNAAKNLIFWRKLFPLFAIALCVLIFAPIVYDFSGNGLVARIIVSFVMIGLSLGLPYYAKFATATMLLLGRHTMIIYLFNVPIIGLFLTIWRRTIGYEGAFFPLAIICAIATAISLSIFIKEQIFSHSKTLSYYVA